MYRIKLNDKYYGNVPESLADVSLRRFIKLRAVDMDKPSEIIFWVLDEKVDFEESDTIEHELQNLLALTMPVIDEVYAWMQSKKQLDKPHSIELLDRRISVTHMLAGQLPYWAYVATKHIINQEATARPDEPLDVTDRYPDILAHYLYTLATKREYVEAEADKFAEITATMNMVPAIQLGNFFLLRQKALLKSRQKSSKQKSKKTTSRRA